MNSPRQVAQAWLDAYNARDPHALIALYHDDAVNHQVAFGPAIQGREALLDSFIAFFRAFPDSETHVENLFVDGEWAIIEWQGFGTFSGELGDYPPNGQTFSLRGCGFLHVIEGRIKFQRGYIDKATWFTQIGLPIS